MRSVSLCLFLAVAACGVHPAPATDEVAAALIHCDERWEIDYVFTKEHHESELCPEIPGFFVTVLYPCPAFPVTPTLIEYPLWDCENVDDEYVECAGYFDEDLQVATLQLTTESAELIAGDCYYVFEPGGGLTSP